MARNSILLLVLFISCKAYGQQENIQIPEQQKKTRIEVASCDYEIDIEQDKIFSYPHVHQHISSITDSNQFVGHRNFALSYSEKNEQAEWVFYRISTSHINGQQRRTDNFREDPLVITGSASLKDYRGSGYDRGHLCPAGSMKLNKTVMSETFYMSNMSPQVPSFNRGIWKKLEQQVRIFAKKEKQVFVFTGPILDTCIDYIGQNNVCVPARYYKIIYDLIGDDECKAIAFIMKNEKSSEPLESFVVTVDVVEKETGIDFFPCLEDIFEENLESSVNNDLWFK